MATIETKDAIAHKRRIAEALMAQSTDGKSFGGGLAGIIGALTKGAQGYIGASELGQADASESNRSRMIAEAIDKSKSPADLRSASFAYDEPGLLQVAESQTRASEHAADRADEEKWHKLSHELQKANLNKPNWDLIPGTNQVINMNDPSGGTRQIPGYSPQPAFRPPSPEEKTQYPGASYITPEGPKFPPASAATVNLSTAEPADSKLFGELAKGEADTWKNIEEAGNTSAGVNQDLGALDELMTMAPQGPIQGRLINAFPGINSAGDAANAIIKRSAPALRVQGSGSTSDVEYEGMLKAYPSLVNQPGANRMISAVMRAKAELNIERGAIVTAAKNREITPTEARKRLSEINRRSILTPEMKSLFQKESGWNDMGNGVRIREMP